MISSILLLIGSLVIFVGSYGVLKQRSTLAKMQYATLINTVGILLILLGTALHFKTLTIVITGDFNQYRNSSHYAIISSLSSRLCE